MYPVGSHCANTVYNLYRFREPIGRAQSKMENYQQFN
jgi:hypothetical protein